MFSGDTPNYYDGAWSTGWEIHIGEFNGDRRADIFVYNSTTGRWFEVISGPTPRNFAYYEGLWSPGWRVKMTELNHDGRTDIHVYDATTGRFFEMTTLGIATFDYLMGFAASNSVLTFAGSR
jgi:hypothetical protein